MSLCSDILAANGSQLFGNASEAQAPEDVAVQVFTNLFLFLLVFGVAGTVDFQVLKHRLREKKGIAVGLLCQYILLPLIGFITVQMFNSAFSTESIMAQMLILTVSLPGGSQSNWWSSMANADLALSVALTAISNVLSMGMLPLNVYLYGTLALQSTTGSGSSATTVALPWDKLGISLGIVLCAVFSGIFVGYNYPQYHRKLNILGNIAGVVTLILGIAFSNSGGSGLFSKPAFLYGATAVPVIVAITIALALTSLAGLKKPQRVAVCIEVFYQNILIAVAFAVNLGGPCGREAAGLPILYGMFQLVIVIIFVITAWRMGWTYAPKTDNPLRVLFHNYQDKALEEIEEAAAPETGDDKLAATREARTDGKVVAVENPEV